MRQATSLIISHLLLGCLRLGGKASSTTKCPARSFCVVFHILVYQYSLLTPIYTPLIQKHHWVQLFPLLCVDQPDSPQWGLHRFRSVSLLAIICIKALHRMIPMDANGVGWSGKGWGRRGAGRLTARLRHLLFQGSTQGN